MHNNVDFIGKKIQKTNFIIKYVHSFIFAISIYIICGQYNNKQRL